MSEKMFNALETCLQALEQGETLDTALARFPALAGELRPILEASLHARTLAGFAVPEDVQRRGRARLLQRAAEMREAKRAPRRTWVFTFRPAAVALMLAIFFLSGTGLVRASTSSLPGDNLYPVKRTWEDLRLVFVSTEQEREDLEMAYEEERLDEINELLAEGRTETVSFVGYVTAQVDGQWTVAGVPVIVSEDTILPDQPIAIGAAVTVTGRTNAQGFLAAQSIELVEPGTIVPPLEDEDEGEDSLDGGNGNEGSSLGGGNDNEGSSLGDGNENEIKPGSGSDDDSSGSGGSDDGADSDSKSKLQGKVEKMDGTVWVVNGQKVDVSGAEIVGTPAPGADVVIEGYYNAEGVFIATKVVFSNSDSDNDGTPGPSDDNDNDDNENDDNSNDDNSNDDNSNDDNSNDDNSNNDNSNDDNSNNDNGGD